MIIFGPPGAGKGTQAINIVNKFNLHQVSTGDLLRKEVKNQTEIGRDIENILTKLTTIGALYLTLVCLMPEFLIANYPIPFYLGGTSILIVVVVAIDTVTQIQTRLMSSQYEQLIKKTKFGR